MQEQFAEILGYIKGVVSYKWLIMISVWVCSLIGWGYVFNMPNQFKSEAKVHVDTRTMLRPLLRGIAVQADVRGLIAIMQKLMLTQQNLIKVAELAGIEGDYDSEDGRYQIVNKIKNHVGISGGRGEIFSISYKSSDPLQAQKVVQAVLSVFSEQTQQTTLGDMGTAQRFIDDQIKEYEQRLRIAEKAKENFKRKNLGLLPGQGNDQISNIQNIQNQIENIETKIAEYYATKKVLSVQLNEALESDEEWGLTQSLDEQSEDQGRIDGLLSRKDELLIKYTESHPYITAIDDTIRVLEERADEEQAEDFGNDGYLEALSNPYVQTIKSDLNRVDTEVAVLSTRADHLRNKLSKAEAELNTRLSIETEMHNLNRDYEAIKKNYVQLLQRREKASLSEKADNQAAALKFKVVDPANRPKSPSSPNRVMLYSASLGGGLVIGIGVALLLVLIRPVFMSVKNLRSVTGLPVLGSVSVFKSEEEVRKTRINNVYFGLTSLVLLIGYSSIMAFELMG